MENDNVIITAGQAPQNDTQNNASLNVCVNCGAPLNNGQLFCPTCGHKVGVPAKDNVNAAISQFNSAVEKKNKSKKKLPIIICTVIALLAVAVVVLLFASGFFDKGSGILIEHLESAIKVLDEDGTLTVTKQGNGFYFSYSMANGDYAITGYADRKKNIESITVVGDDISEKYIKNLSERQILMDIGDYMNVPVGRLKAGMLFFRTSLLWFTATNEAIEDEDEVEEEFKFDASIEMMLDAVEEPQTENGWTYTAIVDNAEETVKIEIVYGKK